MPFSIIRDEIAHQTADVIIIPANPALAIDGGAGLAVARVAGLQKIQAACDAIGTCEVGHAVATPAFDFPAKTIVHTVGPAWDESEEAKTLLENSYANALSLAIELGARSIALPLISSGAQGCPSETSLHIALAQVKALLENNPEVDVRIVVFDSPAAQASRELFPGLEQFIDDTYAKAHENLYPWTTQAPNASAPQPYPNRSARYDVSVAQARRSKDTDTGFLGRIRSRAQERKSKHSSKDADRQKVAPSAHPFDSSAGYQSPYQPEYTQSKPSRTLDELLDEVDASFSTTLLTIIDERGLDDAEVYKRANISRQHFSKIRSNPEYRPTKRTVLALAVALKLDLGETEDLLRRAGLAFSPASKADLIVEWFIRQGDYDIFAINEALYAYDQPILG